MPKKSTPEAIAVSSARANLPDEIKRIKPGQPVMLERHGVPVAALVSPADAQQIKQQHQQETQVIMAFNHAGGVGKTSTVRDLGYELAQLGHCVLLIDLDPQANLSVFLGIEDAPASRSVQATLEEYADLPEPYHVHGMDVIAGHLDLTRTERRLPGFTNADGRLRVAIDKVRASGQYDFVLIDAPPSLGVLSANAAACADFVIVPLPAVFKGMVALEGLSEMLQEYTLTNPRLRVACYLITRADNTTHCREVLAAYQRILGAEKLAGPISYRPAVYNRCQPEGQPVGLNDPSGPARAEVQAVTQHLLQVMGLGAAQ